MGIMKKRCRNKGQASMEYLMVVGLVLVVMIPVFYYAVTESGTQVRLNQADDAVNSIAKTADSVYALGPGSRDHVRISVPAGVSGSYVNNSKVGLRLDTGEDIMAFSRAPLTGKIPKGQGIYHVPVEMLDSGVVLIGAANDTSPPEITYTYPSGTISYNDVTIKAETDEPAHCRYSQDDESYSDMEGNFVGTLLSHEKDLGILSDGNHVYYARCEDPYGNIMQSSAVINFTINTTEEYNGTIEFEPDPPIVTLISPPDNKTENTSVVDFTYNVTDASPVSFCGLVLNDTMDKISTNITRGVPQEITSAIDRGWYNWSINCTDMHGNEGASSQRRILINHTLDSDSPVVHLIAPDNNTVRNYWLIKFLYNTTDKTSGISHCILHMNGTLDDGGTLSWNVIDSSVEENNTESITLPLFRANYTWQISCIDDSYSANEGYSGLRNLNINITAGEEAFVNSCAGWCGWEGLSEGTCENNIPKCGSGCGLPYSDSNDCYAGDSTSSEYCTGGAEADTCCCIP
ncbi:MAG: hypothetical protein R6U32_02825 [Candidatus Woesearchaeota archaeon]